MLTWLFSRLLKNLKFIGENESGSYLNLGARLLGAEVPLPQVPFHVPRCVFNLGLGAIQPLLQLGDARLDHLRCQAPVRAGGSPLGLGLSGGLG